MMSQGRLMVDEPVCEEGGSTLGRSTDLMGTSIEFDQFVPHSSLLFALMIPKVEIAAIKTLIQIEQGVTLLLLY
jgi:hypothetical protein